MGTKWLLTILAFLTISLACRCQQKLESSYGLEPSPDSLLQTIPFADYRSNDKAFGPLPTRYDLTDSMPPAMNQGLQFSCAAFSTTYYFLSYIENTKRREGFKKNGQVDQSLLYSPSYVYNSLLATKTPKPNNCQTAITLPSALTFLREKGAPTLVEVPYDSQNNSACLKVSVPNVDQKKMKKILNYQQLRPTEAKQSLARYKKPFIIGMAIPETFNRDGNIASENKTKLIWNYGNVPITETNFHAMTCVGYDDSIAGGAFRIMNSWGANWGDRGTFYIKYKDFMAISKELFIASKGITNLIPYQNLVAIKMQKTSNQLLESNAKNFKVIDSLVKSTKNNNIKIKYKDFSSELKPGHYQSFGNINIGITYIDTKEGDIVMDVFINSNKELIQRLVLKENETSSFLYLGKMMVLHIIKITKAKKMEDYIINYLLIK